MIAASRQAESAAQSRVPPAVQVRDATHAALVVAESTWIAARQEQGRAEEALGEALKARERRMDAEQAWTADVLGRARAWADAAEEGEQQDLERLDRSWRLRIADAESQGIAAIAEAANRARTEAAERLRERIAAADRAVADAGATRDRADAEVVHAQEALKSLEREERDNELARARAEARLAAARARLTVDEESLAGEPRVLDLVAEAERPALLDRMGEHALHPVVSDIDVLVRAANGIESDVGLKAWFRPGKSLPPAAEAAWLPSLRAALQRVSEGQGPAAGPTFRVSADGWVELGATGALRSAAEQEQAVTRHLSSIREQTSELEGRRGTLEANLAEAREARRTAERAYREAQEAASEERAAAHAEAAATESDAESQARALADAHKQDLTRQQDEETAGAVEGRARRIRQLRQELDEAVRVLTERQPDEEGDARIAAVEARAGEARQQQEAALVARDAARLAAGEAVHALERAESAAANATQDRERLEAEGEALAADADAVSEACQQVEVALAESEQRLSQRVETEAGAKQAAADRQAASAAAGTAESEAAGAVHRLERDLSRMREMGAALKVREQAARDRRESAEAAIARAQARATEAARSIEASESARDEAAGRVTEVTEARGRSWDELEARKASLRGLQQRVADEEAAVATLRSELEQQSTRAEQLGARRAKVDQECTLVRQRMEDRYQVDVEVLLATLDEVGSLSLDVDPQVAEGLHIGEHVVEGVPPLVLQTADLVDENQIRRRVHGLDVDRKALAELGEVNLGAIEEYRELEGRFAQMESQRSDLEASMLSIRSAIARMNEICRERFTVAFEQVKQYFHETYPRLVGGGSARLALSDEDDVLESGVEIYVQPPGKRLQNLNLLSGGEKAMTAIALLIALFRVKPSPFCVLDEVDAPLDEANGARFNEMLKEMSHTSQFLVITHNRKTMECADTLYGITMAKPGVSTLVSVRM